VCKTKTRSLQEYTDMHNVSIRQELLQKAYRDSTTVKAQLKYKDDDETKHRTLHSEVFTTWVSNHLKAKAHTCHCGLVHRLHVKK
jgi:hypothetical protein